jgi:branched-subunit amino acid aminotransferase/4-amino-4-deoxychorismate lyase
MLPAGEPSVMHGNRSFCYGDALFESIHANGTRLQFFSNHYDRLKSGMQILSMDKGSLPEANVIESHIVRLLNKNHLYNGVRVRLTVFRNTGGLFTPEDNSVSFLAETQPLPDDIYRLNAKGLKAGVYSVLLKQPGILAGLKTANSLLYIMAGLYKKESGFDECFIMNSEKRPSEFISSNLFLVTKGIVCTPPLTEGCIAGIMREQIIRIARNEGIECRESKLSTEDLYLADECFMTNAIKGIQWVVAFNQKRYYSKTSRLLVNALNKEQFEK